ARFSAPSGNPMGRMRGVDLPRIRPYRLRLDRAEEVLGRRARDRDVADRLGLGDGRRRGQQVRGHAGVEGNVGDGPMAAVVAWGAGRGAGDAELAADAVVDLVESVDAPVGKGSRGYDSAYDRPVVVEVSEPGRRGQGRTGGEREGGGESGERETHAIHPSSIGRGRAPIATLRAFAPT